MTKTFDINVFFCGACTAAAIIYPIAVASNPPLGLALFAINISAAALNWAASRL